MAPEIKPAISNGRHDVSAAAVGTTWIADPGHPGDRHRNTYEVDAAASTGDRSRPRQACRELSSLGGATISTLLVARASPGGWPCSLHRRPSVVEKATAISQQQGFEGVQPVEGGSP